MKEVETMAALEATDKRIPPAVEKETPSVKQVVVKDCERLNVRALPQASAEVLGVVTRGTRLTVINETAEWVHVNSVYGEGYVMKKFTEVI